MSSSAKEQGLTPTTGERENVCFFDLLLPLLIYCLLCLIYEGP
jgi:hypothetical protein